MKILKSAFLALFFVTLLSSCNKLQPISIDFNGSEFSLNIAPTTFVGTQNAADQTTATNIDQVLSDNGIDAGRIEEISISSLNLRVINSASSFSFNHLDNVEVTIGADGLADKTLVAHVFDATPSTTVAINVDSGNLKDYLSKDNVTYKVSITNNTAITEMLTLGVTPDYTLKAKIFK